MGGEEADMARLSQAVPAPAVLPAPDFAAGGGVAPAGDLPRFVQALRDGRLPPLPLFMEATTPQREFMGPGFFATGDGPDVPGRDLRRGHGGNADGICIEVRPHPYTGETVIEVSNRGAPACFAASSLLHAQRKGSP